MKKKERNQKKKVFISWQPEVSFLPFQHVQGEDSSSTKPNWSQPPVLRQGDMTKQQKCWYVKALKAEVWFSQRYDMLFFVSFTNLSGFSNLLFCSRDLRAVNLSPVVFVSCKAHWISLMYTMCSTPKVSSPWLHFFRFWGFLSQWLRRRR